MYKPKEKQSLNDKQRRANIFALTFRNIFENLQLRVAFERLIDEKSPVSEKEEEQKEEAELVNPEVSFLIQKEEIKQEEQLQSQSLDDLREEAKVQTTQLEISIKEVQPILKSALDPETLAQQILENLNKQFNPKQFTKINFKLPES